MLALAGGKGGSGKTTSTLGLAAAIDGPTVVVDADRDMPNCHALADVEREPTLAALATGEATFAEVGQPWPAHPEVTVCPAPPADASVDLDRALDRVRAAVDAPVLCDCPAGAGPDAAAPLRVADGALLVGTLCAPALRDTAKTAAMARTLGTPVRGAVLTRTRLAPEAVADLLDCAVLASVPRAEPPVLDAYRVRRVYRRLVKQLVTNEEL
jgi:septum site-determining protein MinD